ncbi:MAG: methionine--tRNA ligase [Anaerolineales bacterium]|nr:methionine--tRNA ligase [Anaerolineales bacterium]
MSETVLAAVAWPYANSDIHVGNITGSYLPADIFTRYHRLAGNRVLMVSGTDSHGTAITVRADADGKEPLEVYQHFHRRFLDLFQQLGLQYDLFTSTHTENHFKVTQTIFLALKENGYLYVDRSQQWYSPAQKRFLPDRYIEGTCYICQYDKARGDQCDNCGNLLDATQLISPRSTADGSTPELRETEHYYLDLGKLQPAIVEFLTARESYWRPNVLRQSLGQIQSEGLRGRPISRDLDWGIPVPVEGWDGKCIYVWFEAVIGYLSATIEWAKLTGNPESWRDWWTAPDAKSYYFIGKDNIPFHAVIWPGQLYGVGEQFARLYEELEQAPLNLPHDVPANEFMNLEGKKISGSRNWAVYGLDFLTRYDPDALRFYLTATMPESRDSDWDWSDFVRRNNDELVATWGNLANRVLSFAYRNWEGQVPDPGELRDQDRAILAEIEAGFTSVGDLLEAVKLRAALAEALRLAAEVNRYLDQSAPWFEIKENPEEAAKTIYTSLRAVDSLKTIFAPFLPFSSEKLHTYLGYQGSLFGSQSVESVDDNLGDHQVLRYNAGGSGRWAPSDLAAGTAIRKPEPLFRKLETSIAEEERSRLGE